MSRVYTVDDVEELVKVVREGHPDQEATADAARALGNLAFDGHAAEVVKAGAVEALVGVVRDGRPDQDATARAAAALGNLAIHEPLRAVLRRANLLEPLAEKLDATGLNPYARFQGLAAVAMLYGEDTGNEHANALMSRHDVARLAVAATRSALAETKCEELSDENGTNFPQMSEVLPQMRSMSVHAQTRDRLMEEGAVPLVVRGLGAAKTPTDRVHAIRCLLNFAWAGQTAVLKLRESGAVEAAKPWAETTTNDDEMEVRDAARGLLQVLGEGAAAAAPTTTDRDDSTDLVTGDDDGTSSSAAEKGEQVIHLQQKRYGVFLSHKQTDARDFARALYTLFESRNIKCFLDMEFKDDLNDLEAIVSTSKTLLFVLSDNVLESEWCLKELAAAVRHNVKIVMVVKEGARWPDKNGDYVCTFPPYPLIQKLPAEVQPAFAVKAIEHVNSYYSAFVSALLEKVDAQQAQLDSLQGQVTAAAASAASASAASAASAASHSSDGGALEKARAALRDHLERVHPALGLYLPALHELGVDTVDDLGELAGPSIHTTI